MDASFRLRIGNWIFRGLGLGGVSGAWDKSEIGATVQASIVASVTVGGAMQYDFVSRVNGLADRVFVSMPLNADPQRAYPVFYVLNGNYYFAAASNQAMFASGARRYPPESCACRIVAGSV